MNSQEIEATREIPKEIEKRRSDYHKYFRVARTLHYSIGVFGLTCSLLATSGFGGGDVPTLLGRLVQGSVLVYLPL